MSNSDVGRLKNLSFQHIAFQTTVTNIDQVEVVLLQTELLLPGERTDRCEWVRYFRVFIGAAFNLRLRIFRTPSSSTNRFWFVDPYIFNFCTYSKAIEKFDRNQFLVNAKKRRFHF